MVQGVEGLILGIISTGFAWFGASAFWGFGFHISRTPESLRLEGLDLS